MYRNTEINKQYWANSILDLENIAKEIIDFAKDLKIWIFKGPMGVGKTTLIKQICNCFSIEDEVTSPTYSIVNEYENKAGEIFYHFDFYRIKSELEALDIGYEEYFYSKNYCFIEWPERIENLMPQQYLVIDMKILENGKRNIEIYKHV